MLMLAGRPLVMEEAVRNYSRRKVQRQPRCRAFFRSDAPTRPPAREAASVRLMNSRWRGLQINQSASDSSKKPLHHSRRRGKSERHDNVSAISSETARPIRTLNLLARQNAPNVKRDHKKRGAQASSGGEGLLSPDKARHSIRAAAPCNSGALSDGAEQRGDKM